MDTSSLQHPCLSNLDSQSGSLFLLLLNTLLASQCALKNPKNYPEDKGAEIQDGDHFDFIVVGSGSSGSVLASTLVREGNWKVLVLEAGGIPSITSEIPMLAENTIKLADTRMYSTEPCKTSCIGMKNGSCHWPRGQVLGGSSTINSMVYIRGNKANYDNWADQGNPTWNNEHVVSHYESIEKFLETESEYYGKGGFLPLTKYSVNETIRDVILESAKEMHLDVLEGDGKVGFLEAPLTTDGKTRANAAKIFLGSVKDSNNIALALNALVQNVLINKATKQAEGVEVIISGRKLKVYADKEVILSAGALNSPQLLMLSGIGPKDSLNNLGIEVIQNSPVGKNLQDHIYFTIYSKVKNSAMKIKNEQETFDEVYKYFAHGEGELSTIGITNIQGFINTKNDSEFPDVQMTFASVPKGDSFFREIYMDNLNINAETSQNLIELSQNHNMLMTLIVLLQPKSRGNVQLKSSDPSDNVRIDSGYLTDPLGEDIDTIVRGIRFAQAQMKTSSFQKVDPVVLDIGIPDCREKEFDSDEYWKCAVRNLGTTLYHPTSTCKMGPKGDEDAVVDSELKVYGVDRLRVVDASVMPNIISGNTNAPSMMIGHKAAHMILQEYRQKHTEL